MTEFQDLLVAELAAAGISLPLSAQQLTRLEAHYSLLTTWNKRINLTSIRTLAESVRRHYCECLYFGSLLSQQPEFQAVGTVLDAGSGGGFPGIPLAILYPGSRIVLVEADQRKAVFLREASRALPNVSVECRRLEDLQASVDWLVSRAVRPGDVLAQLPRLGRHAGLLLGPGGVQESHAHSQIHWDDGVALPWGEQTSALFGNYHEL